jgi:uncharacterized protein
MKKIITGCFIAAIFWFIMFSPWTAHIFNFWAVMMTATGLLTFYSLLSGREDLKEVYSFKPKWIVIGIISAASLYLLFFAGNEISKLIFNFTKSQVTNIYETKNQADKVFIGLALLLWIGPAEEIFWRGYIQHSFSKKYGDVKAFLITTLIYAFVHIWAFNFILIMAALICGLFWGWMFLKFKSVIPGIISHAIWDLFIFIIIPVR